MKHTKHTSAVKPKAKYSTELSTDEMPMSWRRGRRAGNSDDCDDDDDVTTIGRRRRRRRQQREATKETRTRRRRWKRLHQATTTLATAAATATTTITTTSSTPRTTPTPFNGPFNERQQISDDTKTDSRILLKPPLESWKQADNAIQSLQPYQQQQSNDKALANQRYASIYFQKII